LFVVWFLGARLDAENERLRMQLAKARRDKLDLAEKVKESTLREIRLDQQLGRLKVKEREMFARELQAIDDQERFEREVVGGSGQEGVVPSGSSDGQVDLNADFHDPSALPSSGDWWDLALGDVDFGGGTPQPFGERSPGS
jgi:hypothetical protein